VIPDYQTLMLPVLQALEDGKDHKKQDLVTQLGVQFQLTSDDLTQLLPSGTQKVFESRVGWAITYMKKAGLIESPQKAVFRATKRGLTTLASGPSVINNKMLMQYPEFVQFIKNSPKPDGKVASQGDPVGEQSVLELTPEEVLRQAHQRVMHALASDLLDRVKKCSPAFFERLVVKLLVALGYGGTESDAAQAVGKSGDGGIDGIIKEDVLGLDVIYLQAKRYDNATVGRPAIQQFVGALSGRHANKGVFITTSSFSPDAQNYASAITQKVILIDGEQLARLMIRTGVGVTTTETLELKRVDSDYFEEE